MSTTQRVRKPFAGFEDHDACVREHQDKEDPDAFCAWLAEHAKDALSDPNAETVLTALTTEFVSSVDEPAQRSDWLIVKDATANRRDASTVERPFVFADRAELTEKAADVDVRAVNDDGERQIGYAAVLVPNEVDKQGDVIPPYVVELAAHEYMAEFRKMDSDHDLQDGAGTPVESWILKQDQDFELPDGGTVTYPQGTWLIGKRFVDDEWERVKAGELNGFSIYGGAQAIDVDELADEVKTVNRRADKGVPGHASTMLDAFKAASKSDTPQATLTDRIQRAKAELPDEDAQMVVEMLRSAADAVADSIDGNGDPAEDAGDEDDETEQSAKDQPMTDENDTPEDGGTTDEPTGDAVTDGGNPEGDGNADDIHAKLDDISSTVKSTKERVEDFDGRLDAVEDEVDTLKENVDVDDPAPGNDRLNEDDDDDRLKSIAKDAASDAVAELAGVDPDDADDADVVRKGLREQFGADTGGSTDLGGEDYSGIFDDDSGNAVSKTAGPTGNKRFADGDD